MNYRIDIELLSDATFGRGDGIAGLLDQEVEHDIYGLPYLRGRTLKGLLSEECENLIELFEPEQKRHWQAVACELFGTLGSTLNTIAAAHFGDACLPKELQRAIAYQLEEHHISTDEVLNAVTTLRRQTAIDALTGAPDKGSLRTARVVLRSLIFSAEIQFDAPPGNDMLSLLALGTAALRRLGGGRNRGRGQVRCSLHDPQKQKGTDITEQYLEAFNPGKVETAA